MDAIVAHQRGPVQVYKNTVHAERGWIAFALEGTTSNRSAIGAELHLYWAGMEQVQQIEGGNGFAAQNQRRAHFGLGTAPSVDSVVVRWPSGKTQTFLTPEINTLHHISEPE